MEPVARVVCFCYDAGHALLLLRGSIRLLHWLLQRQHLAGNAPLQAPEVQTQASNTTQVQDL
jgi:hypothetical protein